MSTQKFTIDERFAFWEVYDKKCIYCGNPIMELSSLRIDHLLPERLADEKSKDELNILLAKHLLSNDYNIFDYYNLVASCSKCNDMKSSKTGLIINPVILEVASSNASKIEKKVKIFRRKIAANNVNQFSTVPFFLKFRDNNIKGLLSKSKLVDLYDLPVYAGGIEDFVLEGFEGGRPDNPPIINTVAEYVNALNNGWYADTTFSIKVSGWFEEVQCFLHALEKAKLPRISYFSDNQFNFRTINELSDMLAYPSYVPDFEMEQYAYKFNENRSLQDYFDYLSAHQTPAKINKHEENILSFEAEHTCFYLEELLRADISGNGYEEILCILGLQVVGGSLGFSSVILLQKESPDVLATFKYYECS